jgi:PAS domain S-box-containing protein
LNTDSIHHAMDDARKSGDALQRSESTVRALLESAAQAILAVNADGILVLANDTVNKMFGYNPDQLIGQPLELLVPKDVQHRHREYQKAFFANPRNRPMGMGLDLEGQRKDGSRFPIEVSLNHIETPEGRLGVAFVSDITERKRVEEALHRSELQYRGLFEHMLEGLAYCKMIFENGLGSDFIYLTVNQRFEILTGLKDVTGKRATEVIPRIRELDPGLLEIYARVALTGMPEKFEMFINSLGQWYSVSAYSPEKGFFVAIFDVIGERKRMEDALHQSEESLRLAVDSTGLGTFDFDPRTGKLILSDVSKGYFGLPPGAEVGDTTFRKGIHPDDRDRVQRIVEEAMRPGSRGQYAAEYRTIGINDGKERWISAWGRVLFDRLGQPERFIGVMLDITDKKRLEKAVEASRNEIRALAASLLTAQEEDRRRVSRELHDQICQQLASLAIDMGGLVADPPPPEDAQSRLKALQARVVKASEETRHIAHELHPSVLDDLGMVASLQSLCKEFSERAGIPVEFTNVALPGSVPREVASCLYRVAQESLQNIAKYANAKHVSVALTLQKGTEVLTIADDGAGFDQEAVKGRGGLGLIGMEERARLVNGNLSIATQPGHGTRIALEVPLPTGSL